MGSSEFRLTDGLLNPCEPWFPHLQSGTNDSNPTGLAESKRRCGRVFSGTTVSLWAPPLPLASNLHFICNAEPDPAGQGSFYAGLRSLGLLT